MGKTITFINMKGGVGKTTTAVNVGYTIAKQYNKRVLLIDMDPQMNATQYTLNNTQVREILNKPSNTVYGILSPTNDYPKIVGEVDQEEKLDPKDYIYNIREHFDIIPSHLELMSLNLNERPLKLKKFIESELKDSYDVIILDCPPTISGYTKLSLLSSDSYIVPMKTDYLSFFGLPLLENYISTLKADFEKDLEFMGIILTMVRTDWRIYGDVKNLIKKEPRWKNKLFKAEMRNKTMIENALSPENKNENKNYILELDEVKDQIINITQEFMIKGRL